MNGQGQRLIQLWRYSVIDDDVSSFSHHDWSCVIKKLHISLSIYDYSTVTRMILLKAEHLNEDQVTAVKC